MLRWNVDTRLLVLWAFNHKFRTQLTMFRPSVIIVNLPSFSVFFTSSPTTCFPRLFRKLFWAELLFYVIVVMRPFLAGNSRTVLVVKAKTCFLLLLPLTLTDVIFKSYFRLVSFPKCNLFSCWNGFLCRLFACLSSSLPTGTEEAVTAC